ncbi:MAG: hypothetical protein HUJ69_00405 [Lachnospiraceae bacterium]|nr:hypothetical protein [Lachnospiraceae bacterium]
MTDSVKRSGFLGSDMFTDKSIWGMLFPLIMDQLFIYAIGLLTTAMISSSGESSVAAVSLVAPISQLPLAFYSAFAAGGGVIIAQYKGHGDETKVKEAIAQTWFVVMALAVLMNGIPFFLAKPIIESLFPTADPLVKEKAVTYMAGMMLNNIVHAPRVACTAGLRATGEIKVNTWGGILLNSAFFVFSFIFLNLLHMDIQGSLLSYFLARMVGLIYSVLWSFILPGSKVRIPVRYMLKPKADYISSILKLGLPFSAEEMFFNLGTVVASTFIVLLGTSSVAANAIVNSLMNTMYAPVSAVGLLATTVVGQCIGAGRQDLAKWYGKRLVQLGYVVCLVWVLIMLLLMKPILGIYKPTEQVLPMVRKLMLMGAAGMLLIYPVSMVIPYVLKAAGDAYYPTLVSLLAMWALRVGLGYVAAVPLGMGIYGIQWMMIGEWLVRSILFGVRYKGKTWLTKKAIKTE